MINRMLLRLFTEPLLLLLLAPTALWFLGRFIPNHFRGILIFEGLAQQAAGLAFPGCWVLASTAVVTALYQSIRFWLWDHGKTETCHNCEGMVSLCDGRWGFYFQYFACGEKRSA